MNLLLHPGYFLISFTILLGDGVQNECLLGG